MTSRMAMARSSLFARSIMFFLLWLDVVCRVFAQQQSLACPATVTVTSTETVTYPALSSSTNEILTSSDNVDTSDTRTSNQTVTSTIRVTTVIALTGAATPDELDTTDSTLGEGTGTDTISSTIMVSNVKLVQVLDGRQAISSSTTEMCPGQVTVTQLATVTALAGSVQTSTQSPSTKASTSITTTSTSRMGSSSKSARPITSTTTPPASSKGSTSSPKPNSGGSSTSLPSTRRTSSATSQTDIPTATVTTPRSSSQSRLSSTQQPSKTAVPLSLSSESASMSPSSSSDRTSSQTTTPLLSSTSSSKISTKPVASIQPTTLKGQSSTQSSSGQISLSSLSLPTSSTSQSLGLPTSTTSMPILLPTTTTIWTPFPDASSLISLAPPAGVQRSSSDPLYIGWWATMTPTLGCKPPCDQEIPPQTFSSNQTFSFDKFTTSVCRKIGTIYYSSKTTVQFTPVITNVISFLPFAADNDDHLGIGLGDAGLPMLGLQQSTQSLTVPAGVTTCPNRFWKPSKDGTCGEANHYQCKKGKCCSKDGKCSGDTEDEEHCGKGCQPNWGKCWKNETAFLPWAKVWGSKCTGSDCLPGGHPVVIQIHPPPWPPIKWPVVKFPKIKCEYLPFGCPFTCGLFGCGGYPGSWFLRIPFKSNCGNPIIRWVCRHLLGGICCPKKGDEHKSGCKVPWCDQDEDHNNPIDGSDQSCASDSCCTNDCAEDPGDCSHTLTATDATFDCLKVTNQAGKTHTTCSKTRYSTKTGCTVVPHTTTQFTTSDCTESVTQTIKSVLCPVITKLGDNSQQTTVTQTGDCGTHTTITKGCQATGKTTTNFKTCSATSTVTDYTYSCVRLASQQGSMNVTCIKTQSAITSGCDLSPSTTSVFACPRQTVSVSPDDDYGMISREPESCQASTTMTATDVTKSCYISYKTLGSNTVSTVTSCTATKTYITEGPCVTATTTSTFTTISACPRPIITIIPLQISSTTPSCPKPAITVVPLNITEAHSCPLKPTGVDIDPDGDQGEDGPNPSKNPNSASATQTLTGALGLSSKLSQFSKTHTSITPTETLTGALGLSSKLSDFSKTHTTPSPTPTSFPSGATPHACEAIDTQLGICATFSMTSGSLLSLSCGCYKFFSWMATVYDTPTSVFPANTRCPTQVQCPNAIISSPAQTCLPTGWAATCTKFTKLSGLTQGEDGNVYSTTETLCGCTGPEVTFPVWQLCGGGPDCPNQKGEANIFSAG